MRKEAYYIQSRLNLRQDWIVVSSNSSFILQALFVCGVLAYCIMKPKKMIKPLMCNIMGHVVSGK